MEIKELLKTANQKFITNNFGEWAQVRNQIMRMIKDNLISIEDVYYQAKTINNKNFILI